MGFYRWITLLFVIASIASFSSKDASRISVLNFWSYFVRRLLFPLQVGIALIWFFSSPAYDTVYFADVDCEIASMITRAMGRTFAAFRLTENEPGACEYPTTITISASTKNIICSSQLRISWVVRYSCLVTAISNLDRLKVTVFNIGYERIFA